MTVLSSSLHGPRYPSLVILWASTYHAAWGAILVAGLPAPLFTASAGLQEILPNAFVRGVFLILVSVSALWGQYYLRSFQATARLMSALPQQFVLLLSAGAALSAVVNQRYPDGTPRPWFFILLDQLPLVLGAIMYSIAIIWPAIALSWRTRAANDA